MAKADFVQGQRLKALIEKESLDEASTASLANLFAQVMAKNRDYEYDEITKKLTKAAGKPIKGKQSIGDVYEMMGADTSKSAKKPINKSTMYPSVREAMTPKKKNTFVPEITDTDVIMASPPRGLPKNFDTKIDASKIAHRKIPQPKIAHQNQRQKIHTYQQTLIRCINQ
ncbi:TPA: hypothetical protein N0F65_012928 [Lagenidium giganteum]|uniref:Uncharacterized protein n=1 Tax=Lagenidium giganteum TaxID=4803 RepID=A0AAV2Z178_9STRA|nr:TPA: hypothetical protein N0F65_012928 [Lagenidium giganteum]